MFKDTIFGKIFNFNGDGHGDLLEEIIGLSILGELE